MLDRPQTTRALARLKPGRFSFTLRALLLLMLVASIPLASIGSRLVAARKQQAIKTRIEQLGGRVGYDDEYAVFLKMRKEGLSGVINVPVDGSWQCRLFGFDYCHQIVSVHFTGYSPATDSNVGLADDDLKVLVALPGLRDLSMDLQPITDAGLEHLAGLSQLSFLSCYGSHVTDAGLISLARLKELKSLTVAGTKISVAAVAARLGSWKLENANFSAGQIQAAGGLEQVQAMLPDIQVVEYDLRPGGGGMF